MKRTAAVFLGLLSLYLGTGLLALVFGVVVGLQDGTTANSFFTLRRIVLPAKVTKGGIVMGGIIILSFGYGVYGFVRSRRINKGCTRALHLFNWSVVVAGIATIIVGVLAWFVTLRPLSEFATAWLKQTPATRQYLQDTLHCCGYWNATAAGLFNTTSAGFCAAVASGTNTTAVQPCVTPITSFEDFLMNTLFTTLFAAAAVQVCLVLMTCGIIKVQSEEYRFTLIDAKRGDRRGMSP